MLRVAQVPRRRWRRSKKLSTGRLGEAVAQVWAGSNTISSAQTSSGIGLDPLARTTMVLLDLTALATSTGAGTTDITIQATLDVPTPSISGLTQTWNNISSVHYSSASFGTVGVLTISSPLAGLRLSSTTWAGGVTTVTLRALQSQLD